jgi:hypothetical protein
MVRCGAHYYPLQSNRGWPQEPPPPPAVLVSGVGREEDLPPRPVPEVNRYRRRAGRGLCLPPRLKSRLSGTEFFSMTKTTEKAAKAAQAKTPAKSEGPAKRKAAAKAAQAKNPAKSKRPAKRKAAAKAAQAKTPVKSKRPAKRKAAAKAAQAKTPAKSKRPAKRKAATK